MNRTMLAVVGVAMLGSASLVWAGCSMGGKGCTMDDGQTKAPTTQPAATTQPSAKAAKYVCPMNDGGESNHAGKCPNCGMDLVEKKG